MSAYTPQIVENAMEYFAKKVAFSTGPVEVSHMIEKGEDFALIDVREPEDYAKGHLPGAVNLPEPRWITAEGLRPDALNILYCYSQTCHLAARAAKELAGQGFQVMEMDGGFEAWEDKDLPVEKKGKS